MTATFPKVDGRIRNATFSWANGVVAETPLGGRWQRLPHDLQHLIVEAHAAPPYGFWSLARQQAPFKSFTLVAGRWPRERVEWFDRVKRKHREEMVQAEAVGVIDALARKELDLHADWPAIRRQLTRAYALTKESAFAHLQQADLLPMIEWHHLLHGAWEALARDGAMVVDWGSGRGPIVTCVDGRDPSGREIARLR